MISFTDTAQLALNAASDFAAKTGGFFGTEHLLAGIMSVNCDVTSMLKSHGLSLEGVIAQLGDVQPMKISNVRVSDNATVVIKKAATIAQSMNSAAVDVKHLLLSLLDTPSVATSIIMAYGVNPRDMYSELSGKQNGLFDDLTDMYRNASGFNVQGGKPSGGADLPEELKNIAEDLTAKARNNKLDPVIGRQDEIERIIQILSRRTKNNPVLIGEPGVGKTAIVEGLAEAIVAGNVPETLKNKRIVALDVAGVIAGTKYRGEFEERIKNAIEAIKAAGDIITFIDEIHMIVGAGSTSDTSMDIANILKPMLARGDLQVVGATTIEEYRKNIEKDAALERRFQPIVVNPPSVEDTIVILQGLRKKYEDHHKVKITDAALVAAAELSDRYIADRFLPDKAIDLIDEASSRKRIKNFTAPDDINALEGEISALEGRINESAKREDYETAAKLKKEKDELVLKLSRSKLNWSSEVNTAGIEITEDDIAEIVSKWTSVPVVKLTEAESDRLMNLETELGKRVIGQREAISALSRAIRRARAGLGDPKRPIGSFIFMGPTGVGKTELCKALAAHLFGDENMIVRVDMSEYMDKTSVSKLTGSAPGYVGFEEGGQLTEKIRRKPYSVVLFDEIEKAHPDVFNLLLQILDDGRLTDSHGRTVSFKNTIIIMTSNIGANSGKFTKHLGFGSVDEYENEREVQLDALKSVMRPEFINRLDDVIVFHSLTEENISDIAAIMIDGLTQRLRAKNIGMVLTDNAKKFIINKGTNVEYGARPLRRTLERLLEDVLSEKLIRGEVAIGDTVTVDYTGGEELTFVANAVR